MCTKPNFAFEFNTYLENKCPKISLTILINANSWNQQSMGL